MNDSLPQQAIQASLKGDWVASLKLNKKILSNLPDDLDALNRITLAYFELKKIKEAKRTINKILKIDCQNRIALKFKEKINTFSPTNTHVTVPQYYLVSAPGVSKIITLKNLTSINCSLICGEEVNINFNSHHVSITTCDGRIIGHLPDSVGIRIKCLSKKGNIYKAYIKNASENLVKIIIRETFRSKQNQGIDSFPRD